MTEKEWKEFVKQVLKREFRKKKITYPKLIEKLKDIGVHESLFSIKNKISRGSFNAVFFMQCLKAIDCKTVRIRDKE